jgi:hypothetical protein
MLKMNPDNEKLQAAYEQDLTEIGRILEERRDLSGALEKYQAALSDPYVDIPSIIMYINPFSDHYYGHYI